MAPRTLRPWRAPSRRQTGTRRQLEAQRHLVPPAAQGQSRAPPPRTAAVANHTTTSRRQGEDSGSEYHQGGKTVAVPSRRNRFLSEYLQGGKTAAIPARSHRPRLPAVTTSHPPPTSQARARRGARRRHVRPTSRAILPALHTQVQEPIFPTQPFRHTGRTSTHARLTDLRPVPCRRRR